MLTLGVSKHRQPYTCCVVSVKKQDHHRCFSTAWTEANCAEPRAKLFSDLYLSQRESLFYPATDANK